MPALIVAVTVVVAINLSQPEVIFSSTVMMLLPNALAPKSQYRKMFKLEAWDLHAVHMSCAMLEASLSRLTTASLLQTTHALGNR